MKTFKLVISTPDGNMFEEEIVKISLRGADGDLAVMAGHVPFITSVKPCISKIETIDSEKSLKVDGGILSVGADKTTLMSGGCTWIEE